MAICNDNKYSQSELQQFIDRIENVLQHDVCREEYKTFLKKMKKNDMVKMLEYWELADDIKKNTPGTPDWKQKTEILQEKVEDEPAFSTIDEDEDLVLQVNMIASAKLQNTHKRFVDYLNKNYR